MYGFQRRRRRAPILDRLSLADIGPDARDALWIDFRARVIEHQRDDAVWILIGHDHRHQGAHRCAHHNAFIDAAVVQQRPHVL